MIKEVFHRNTVVKCIMYKEKLFLVSELAAVAAAAIYSFSATTETDKIVISALAFCCLFLIDFIARRNQKRRKLSAACCIVGILFCFFYMPSELYAVLLVQCYRLIYLLINRSDQNGELAKLAGIAALLSGVLCRPNIYSASAAIIISVIGGFGFIVCDKFERIKELCNNHGGEIARLNEKITDLNLYAKTVSEIAAMEERSRFSARIHDKLGHSISGSIILLEGAQLNIDSNSEQAKKSIKKATENLRQGVDSIRMALREEKPRVSAVGEGEVKKILKEFSALYGRKTSFAIEGNPEKISPAIWNCLKENLTETLTNSLKHSNADEFTLSITIYNRIIRATFSDNGNTVIDIEKGMGLSAIEERTARCGGRCLFSSTSTGFTVTNIFT